MSNINCLIIDDEPLARSLIRTFLSQKAGFNICGECTNPTEAYEILLYNDIQVIFLDIQMPVISGMEFLQSLKHPPKIVFTTAYANYAANAFNLNAVDYLVKPITEDRFELALEKISLALNQEKSAPSNTVHNKQPDYIFFKSEGKLTKVFFEDILYLEALKDFTKIFLKSGKFVLVGDHLKAVENQLPEMFFVRSHRSFVVSLKAVNGIFGNTLEIGTYQVPIGGIYKEQLFERLNLK